MSEFKPCLVCQEQSDQCLSCASYVVDGERIYYEKLKDFGATKDHEIRFINRIQKHRVTAFFHNGKLYIPSRQGRSVPLAIGLQWDAWQEQQAIIDDLKAQLNNMEACYIEKKKQVDACAALAAGWSAITWDKTTHWTEGYEEGCYRCSGQIEEALRGAND
ncbi:TPA: hypothetical protein ACHKET_000921 [Acinetobacter baumannii]|uniref:hypothetical protein n=1 Tax=Acinetobacter baumannii TaxID=470 RepID=UPI001EF713FD|nr:hypothetical protein [Acinetobacter baumannii]MCF4632795.1 hypothetical protein [Acinetobacter baumannii]